MMNRPVAVVFTTITVVLLALGCDKEPKTSERPRSATRRSRPAETAPVSAVPREMSPNDSLYLQTLENLHKENRELKQQVADAVKMLLEMEDEIKQIRAEREDAINHANQIQGSIATLQSAALTKDQRIRELEQTNRQMQATITSLTQQVNQLLSELNAAGTTSATGPSNSDDMQ